MLLEDKVAHPSENGILLEGESDKMRAHLKLGKLG